MDLNSIPLLIGNLQAAGAVIREANRADRAEARADDEMIARRIHGASASAHASVAGDLRCRLIGAEHEISRLQRMIDDLTLQRADILAAAADLLKENDALRARLH